jgi:beta-xylosidase
MNTKFVGLIGASIFALALVSLLLATLSVSAAPQVPTSAIWTDNFDNPMLNSKWSWIHETPPHWSLMERPGFLRIMTEKGSLGLGTNKNILLQTVPVGDFEIRTHLFFTPTDDIQQAGIVVYQNDQNYMWLLRAYCGFPSPCAGNAIYFDQAEQGQLIGSNFAMTITTPNEAYLRLIKQGTVYTGYVSSNGTNWITLGTHTVVSGFTPLKIGITVADADFGAPEIPADFDFFQLTDNSGTWTDNFNSPTLDSRWSWIREHAKDWSLTSQPGFMRITAQRGGFFGAGGDSKNLLVQSMPVGNFEIRTRVIFTPTEDFQDAGLLVYQDDDNNFVLGRAYCDLIPSPCVGNGIYFDQEEQGTQIGSNFAMTTTTTNETYLRLQRQGLVYTGYVSLDGTSWTMVGVHTVVSGMVPSKIGLFAHNSGTNAAKIPADFDFFTLTDNSFRVYLPLVIK